MWIEVFRVKKSESKTVCEFHIGEIETAIRYCQILITEKTDAHIDIWTETETGPAPIAELTLFDNNPGSRRRHAKKGS